jgi:membrane associated rhomboid family serine protease
MESRRFDCDGFDGDVQDASSTRTRSPARNRSRGPVQIVENDGIEVTRVTRPLMPPPRPVFCWLAICMCTGTFILQIQQNGWMFQPFTCPTTCAGAPCNDDGSPCEANVMLGPSVAVLDRMGAKNDPAIFERGEWWRVLACNWLHAGFIHLLFNMAAIFQLGVPLERAFGFWRIGTLYLLAGIFGTIVSIIFIPHVLSVGASASVFGLVGAAWADVFVNFAARGTLRGSGLCGLITSTVLNISIGLTPWVDNFMHLGGLVAGIVVGVSLMARKSYDRHTGERRHTASQETCALLATLLLVLLALGAACAVSSAELRDEMRRCDVCDYLNCVETPWWSCCVTQLSGACQLLNRTLEGLVQATCNMSGVAPFSKTCRTSDEWCTFPAHTDINARVYVCGVLCNSC